MSIEIKTSEYEFAHGKKPRGYGGWAFFFGNETEPFWAHGTYSEAKKMAIAMAVIKKVSVIRVGS